MSSLAEIEFIVIGASAGGIDILKSLLSSLMLSQKLKIAVVIHIPAEGPNLIPELMQHETKLKVVEAVSGDVMRPDYIYVAPNDYHLCIEPNSTISLSSEEPVNFSRPAIDILFESAAYSVGAKTLGILLTGANEDGSAGLLKIQQMGGYTIVQDPKDAAYPTMPESALKIMTPSFVMKEKQICIFLKELSETRDNP